jgi:hypothetical protein
MTEAAIDAINSANKVIGAQQSISLSGVLALVGRSVPPAQSIRAAIGTLTPSARAWATTVLT